ncbi:hypothetical protein [Allobaculum sp. JKK-2023]|uniref:hypothetical protein n=1 Tax=Allobaculum sp. JKK-2023 TaxID=3108943 RepID=UPI002B061215|nr:hypothetical protein [Allobaculum sp. JKK-2023]
MVDLSITYIFLSNQNSPDFHKPDFERSEEESLTFVNVSEKHLFSIHEHNMVQIRAESQKMPESRKASRWLQTESFKEEGLKAQSAGCKERNEPFSFVSGWMGGQHQQREARRETKPGQLFFEKTGLTRRSVCCPYRESVN